LNSAKSLLEVQEIDQRLAKSRVEYRKIANLLKAEGDLKKLKSKSEASRVRVLETRLESGKLEAEVASLKEKLEGIETRLYGGAITNLRELTALEEEHNLTKRSLATAEEAVAPARIASDDAALRHDELQESMAATEKQWKTEASEYRKRAQVVSEECNTLESERNSFASDIDAQDLSLYRSLLPRKAGVAVAKVERGICQGCRIKLPMREIARLKNSNSLVLCSSCGRILLAS
jgi:hypothetical protein